MKTKWKIEWKEITLRLYPVSKITLIINFKNLLLGQASGEHIGFFKILADHSLNGWSSATSCLIQVIELISSSPHFLISIEYNDKNYTAKINISPWYAKNGACIAYVD